MRGTKMISINNLTYSINDKLIFKNISAAFNNGEIVGITGPAGSGKKVLIDLLRNKRKDYHGNIFIDDVNLKTADKKKLKKLISHYSLAESIINPEAIVKEWILAGRINHKKRLGSYTELDREIVSKEIENFGLTQISETRLKIISDTYVKIASIAKAFSAQSNLLILEKPEAGLNINQKVILTKCIKKYPVKGDKTVILTSSDLNFLAASCDRIIILGDNGIAESGTHRIITGDFIKKHFNIEAVVTKNIYSGLPEIQIVEES